MGDQMSKISRPRMIRISDEFSYPVMGRYKERVNGNVYLSQNNCAYLSLCILRCSRVRPLIVHLLPTSLEPLRQVPLSAVQVEINMDFRVMEFVVQ